MMMSANKAHARQLLETAITAGERIVCSAEVLQEILYRYVSIGRRDAIQPALDALLGVVDDVFPVERTDVEGAKKVWTGFPPSRPATRSTWR
jgi:uncharacterized protein